MTFCLTIELRDDARSRRLEIVVSETIETTGEELPPEHTPERLQTIPRLVAAPATSEAA